MYLNLYASVEKYSKQGVLEDGVLSEFFGIYQKKY